MPKLELVYFKMRALAEAAQLMLWATDTPYTYSMAWDYFGEPWAGNKTRAPFRQLPMLVIDGGQQQVAQSGAICRYIAGLTGRAGGCRSARGDRQRVRGQSGVVFLAQPDGELRHR